MRTRGMAAVAGVLAAVLFGAGCGAEGAGSGGFGREAAQEEIRAAVAGAGLPKSELPEPGAVTPTATPTAERDRIAQRAGACTAAWQYVGPVVEGARGKYDRTVAALAKEGWTAGNRQVEKLDDKGGTSVGVTLKKSGWTLFARHHAPKTMAMDMVSFQATEDACMSRFSERERELLLGDEQGARD
ncbi:hypothetical protein ABZY68_21680 [Streptomyces sp. NPDC006482]|uniref:hypothetical protein n=1 Tax=Streptomyces sp. NPDC006482 TaxID=3154306 RepID=UPI0033A5BD3C